MVKITNGSFAILYRITYFDFMYRYYDAIFFDVVTLF